MIGSIVVIAFLLSPLACWALLARTKVLGWAFAIVFAAYAIAEGILAPNWRFGGFRIWLLPGLAVMSVVALVVGTVLEKREFGEADPGRGVRGVVGILLASFYGIAVAGAILLLMMVASFGSGPATPTLPVDAVAPLGPGLAVTQYDTSCDENRDPQCEAEFDVTSTSGLSGNALMERVESQLTQAHGWQLSGGTGCRELNGQLVLVEVRRYGNVVTVSLQSSLDPDDIGCTG